MKQIALIGNPNCGKTTLLNALTGANLRVGNWPGVTVERKQAVLMLDDQPVMLNDLPGVYSLVAYSVEEKLAVAYLCSDEPDLILNIVDATNLPRNLYLTLMLRELGLPVVVGLNLMDALETGGGSIDAGRLSQALGVPVVPLSATRREGFDRLKSVLSAAIPSLPKNRPGSVEQFSADLVAARYRRIGRILAEARHVPIQTPARPPDRLALHPVFAYPLFFALIAALFLLTFGPVGSLLTRAMEALVALCAVSLRRVLDGLSVAPWLRSLLLDGALAGVGGVVCFLPQILLLFLGLTALEDSGYMARAALLFDAPLRALGLSGRAFIPLLMGFGCTTTAAVAARSVDDERDKRMTILLLPFMSCGAKLPVYALFGGAFFAGRQGLVVLLLYLLGMLMLALVGGLLQRTLVKPANTPFVLELPPYRRPQWSSVIKRLRLRAQDFAVRAGTLIFLMSMVIWGLQSVTPDMRWAQTAEASIFGRLGARMAPAFAPLGFADWRKCVALLSGLVAKEAVVSTLVVLYRAPDAHALVSLLPLHFSAASAAAFLVFTLLYPPCLSALGSMRRELGSRRLLWLSILIQISAAYIAALIVYQSGALPL